MNKKIMNVNSLKKKELLYSMKRIRLTEETIAERYSEQNMRCPTHLCSGQEAVSAGVGSALCKEDYVVSTHRSHGHYLGKGASLQRMISEIYGKATGCSKGKGGSMHLIDQSVGFMGSTAIVGNTIPVGAGLGLAIQLEGSNQVSCIFLGDGATEEGVFAETVNFSAQRQIPVLFVCENNLYSVYSSLSVRQPVNHSISEMVEAMGIPSKVGNGNNVMEIYSYANEAIQSIRNGNGPLFLEFNTYRWREHCGPNYDNHIGYRTEAEYLKWRKLDPILTFEVELIDEKVMTDKEIDQMNILIAKEVEDAFAFAEKSPFPKPSEAFENIFVGEKL